MWDYHSRLESITTHDQHSHRQTGNHDAGIVVENSHLIHKHEVERGRFNENDIGF